MSIHIDSGYINDHIIMLDVLGENMKKPHHRL